MSQSSKVRYELWVNGPIFLGQLGVQYDGRVSSIKGQQDDSY